MQRNMSIPGKTQSIGIYSSNSKTFGGINRGCRCLSSLRDSGYRTGWTGGAAGIDTVINHIEIFTAITEE